MSAPNNLPFFTFLSLCSAMTTPLVVFLTLPILQLSKLQWSQCHSNCHMCWITRITTDVTNGWAFSLVIITAVENHTQTDQNWRNTNSLQRWWIFLPAATIMQHSQHWLLSNCTSAVHCSGLQQTQRWT